MSILMSGYEAKLMRFDLPVVQIEREVATNPKYEKKLINRLEIDAKYLEEYDEDELFMTTTVPK